MRPGEGGRNVIVRRTTDEQTDITPSPFNARTRVHEYGAGLLLLQAQSTFPTLLISAFTVRLEMPTPTIDRRLTMRLCRRAIIDQLRSRIICVQEEQTGVETVNTLVSINLEVGTCRCWSLSDFYSSPRLNPQGNQLLDQLEPSKCLGMERNVVAEVKTDGSLGPHKQVAGGE